MTKIYAHRSQAIFKYDKSLQKMRVIPVNLGRPGDFREGRYTGKRHVLQLRGGRDIFAPERTLDPQYMVCLLVRKFEWRGIVSIHLR